MGRITNLVVSSLPEDFKPNLFLARLHGSEKAGQALLQNRFLFDGERVVFNDSTFWSIAAKNPMLQVRLHSFQWLGDLASVGTVEAKNMAQKLIQEWLITFGSGKGLGWAPEVVGRRLTWLLRNHWIYLTDGDKDFERSFTGSIQHQYSYLNYFLSSVKEPILCVEALMGLIHAGFFLRKKQSEMDRLYQRLSKEVEKQFPEDGNFLTRNPQELLIYGIILNWVIELADESETTIPEELERLSTRIGKSLSVICHYNGQLARFHGGKDTPSHLVSQTINALTRKDNSTVAKGLGYRKLQLGSTSLIIDVAPPPQIKTTQPVLSTQNTFELTSNFTPLCVNVGFEENMEKTAEYQTQFVNSHSNLQITDSKILDRNTSQDLNEEEDLRSSFNVLKRERGYQILTSQHDVFAIEFGYYHRREIRMDSLGNVVFGTDTLIPNETGLNNDASYTISFNLHPDVMPEWSEQSMSLQFVLPQGEVWDFQYEGRGTMVWNEGIYLDTINSKIIPTNLIQISGSTKGKRSIQRWKLEKIGYTSPDPSLITGDVS
ncbi:MAG: heparinase II/III family protein [Paracoccaceae bacterium]|nr:heparinase II/III family protein [Paracoccaceae bacterium]